MENESEVNTKTPAQTTKQLLKSQNERAKLRRKITKIKYLLYKAYRFRK